MNSNKFIKIICSLRVIFISLYFIPFLGICLGILRQFIYTNKSKSSTSISIITLDILILIPMLLNLILNLVNVNINEFNLNEIIESKIYVNLVNYSKFLPCFGIILLISSFVFKSLIEKYKHIYMDICIPL